MNFEHPPIRPKAFVAQTTYDEEFDRPRAWDGSKWVEYGRGKHGGFDFQDRDGACYAVWDGVVRWVNDGSAFGVAQFVIENKDGLCAFYAHTWKRPRNGKRVRGGAKLRTGLGSVVRIGASGTVAEHLHFEVRESTSWWSIINPGPALRRLKGDLRKAAK